MTPVPIKTTIVDNIENKNSTTATKTVRALRDKVNSYTNKLSLMEICRML